MYVFDMMFVGVSEVLSVTAARSLGIIFEDDVDGCVCVVDFVKGSDVV